MRAFSDWIREQQLLDLPLSGAQYTWIGCQDDLVMSRLVRFFISLSLTDLFHCIQKVVLRPVSYHCPILLVTRLKD